MCCSQGLSPASFRPARQQGKPHPGSFRQTQPWDLFFFFLFFFFFFFSQKLVIENNVKTSQWVRAEGWPVTRASDLADFSSERRIPRPALSRGASGKRARVAAWKLERGDVPGLRGVSCCDCGKKMRPQFVFMVCTSGIAEYY